MDSLHLELTEIGLVYLRSLPDASLFDTLLCGFIGRPSWPHQLGQEPDWFADEIAILRERWDHALAMDEAESRDLLDMRHDRRAIY